MESNESFQLPVSTYQVSRLQDLGCFPRRSDHGFDYFIKELCISHFPQTVKDLLNLFPTFCEETRLIWFTDNVLLTPRNHHVENSFQPVERIPLFYVDVEFYNGYNDGWFCNSPPTYSPTQWSEDTSFSRIGIHAFSAEDAVLVLEKLAQLLDKHDFVWTVNLNILRHPTL